ncbi:biotin-dependent carboxyltransferase family protein [Staphylococcus carnosus]|uniref:Carboxyltransferase domain-containing protein n=2 Tax=Staphylococcus carnosus TaxID=1281 RepID=B9DKK0_STACT|nr:biotin-dependent carboxyltransferase family protein [Staphylococcus carnosus]KKB25843.1 allophanate hydrolase [Staphylococcus carnosus]KOR13059.1 allophanate hydrolase [Staphylococcus carnosus]POA00943.1 allophanate hydrolase [Staphylococcus carnosus]QPT05015.1 biotin-dependent carboxyltransferase [Staphylococcus carnosus]QQS84367.1 biotin-dependent carboxyltransferase [Staphylococcus carnosus]
MSIRIQKPGLFSTIQDEGRIGYQKDGFSGAGALDIYSYRLGQTLIGNDGPAIEATIIGPTLTFLEDDTIVITGAEFKAELNGEPVPHQTVIQVYKGDELAMNAAIKGARGYLFFGHPLDVPEVAGSYSTHTRTKMGGHEGRALKKDDFIHQKLNEKYRKHVGFTSELDLIHETTDTIRIVEGPQYDSFSDESHEGLVSEPFEISEQSDRMGFRLKGPSVPPKESADIISEPVALGSIQVPNDGNPIILMNDKQTVGGYTKIATVTQLDLSVLAQKKPGEKINFEWVSIEDAINDLEEYNNGFEDILKNVETEPLFDLRELRITSNRICELLEGEQ